MMLTGATARDFAITSYHQSWLKASKNVIVRSAQYRTGAIPMKNDLPIIEARFPNDWRHGQPLAVVLL